LGQRFLFSVVAPLAARLPEVVLAGLAVVAGLVGYLIAPGPRRAVDRNLRIVMPGLPQRERRRRVIATFIHGALSYVELFKLAAWDAERLRQAYTSADWHHHDEAVAQGKGIVIACAHLGSFSVAGQAVALRGTPTGVVVEDLQPPELFHKVAALRTRFGARLIPSDRSAVREILKALRSGHVVAIMCDRDVTATGELVRFFGVPTRLSPAAVTFALRTGAPVLPTVAYRTRPFHGVVRMHPPITLTRTGDTAADVQQGMARILAAIESMIAAAPQQWSMFIDVWPDPHVD
jgi:KDO2-lipid IV(A) lauroyltransferase